MGPPWVGAREGRRCAAGLIGTGRERPLLTRERPFFDEPAVRCYSVRVLVRCGARLIRPVCLRRGIMSSREAPNTAYRRYKVQLRLKRFLRDIIERGANKYEYMSRARSLLWALLCQGMLNDPKLQARADEFGQSLSTEAQFTDWASGIATTRCRFIIGEVVNDKLYAPKAAEGTFSFLRTAAAYKRSMEIAHKKWKWVEKRLK